MDLEKLKSDLQVASEAAHGAAAKVGDGGTCNFDSGIIPTSSTQPIKRASKKLDEVFGAFGGTRFKWRFGCGYMLSYTAGQAAKRTVAAVAAAKVLKDWGAYVHYHMD